MEEEPAETRFACGDTVLLKGVPDPEFDGMEGTLVRKAGTTRWVVQVPGKDKSHIVHTGCLVKLAKTTKQSQRGPAGGHSIAGTWDDWDVHPMIWDSQESGFVFDVKIGDDACESFRMMVEGDWDRCLFPDRRDAWPLDGHKICGPSADGLEECWTIGHHQEDTAQPGDVYRVRLLLTSDGEPLCVNWSRLEEKELKAETQAAPVQKTLQPLGGHQRRIIKITGDRHTDKVKRTVEDQLAFQAAALALESARQTDAEGRFEVLVERLAVRRGPSTSAPTAAAAKLGQVVRGIPHNVNGELWLQLDAAAMHRLGATAYTDPGDQAPCGWALVDGQHLGLGMLLRRTTRPEMPDQYGVFTRKEARKRWESMGLIKKEEPRTAVGNGDPFGIASLDRAEAKAEVHPGRTNCLVCGFRAIYTRDKLAHDAPRAMTADSGCAPTRQS
eukprot:CAMPEP_0204577572 /NCGR_PEP_ID=MMETSP0661-20131031/42420_1 /ASSEMBLY_ACC=CAM_ASM_000606 /TAXON_ID=109239 /ORGANISM="Alexandrium margalefi, Strain AMGDE01CS-322" /LENGTH=441 /DNA_ID=CAMNT_0051586419 /DNA_START=51 /DNA_END=1373 /DNA_ORIENTATION=+